MNKKNNNGIERKCIICGKTFIQYGSGVARYCSNECRHKGKLLQYEIYRQKRKLEYKTNYCIICGKETESLKAKYCSECRHKRQSERILGENNPSVKYPRKMSEKNKLILSQKMKGYSNSQGTIGVNNGEINKRIKPYELQTYLSQGWFVGWKPGTINNKAPHSRISKASEIIFNTIKENGVYDIKKEICFEDCCAKMMLPFDFGIYKKDSNYSELVAIIEYDGSQHYSPVMWRGVTNIKDCYSSFICRQVYDWIKDKYCIDNSIPLIRIKEHYNKEFNFDNIYKTENTYIVGKAQEYDKKIQCFDVIQEDFVNNKDCTFTIESGVSCTFKCDKECNTQVCQNFALTKESIITTSIDTLINKYMSQSLAKSITFQGLEPLDNLKQLLWFIYYFRKVCKDPIYIWTGYTKDECKDLIFLINNKMHWENIIIKFGRFIPNHQPHYDDILGVMLSSDNQYAERIS